MVLFSAAVVSDSGQVSVAIDRFNRFLCEFVKFLRWLSQILDRYRSCFRIDSFPGVFVTFSRWLSRILDRVRMVCRSVR